MKRPARIVFTLEYPTVSGGEQSLLEFLHVLDRERFAPVGLIPARGELSKRLEVLEVPFHIFSSGRGKEKRSPEEVSQGLAEILGRMKADLVQGNSLSMGFYTGAAGELAGIPSVAHLRDILRVSRTKMKMLQRNSALVAVSRAVSNWYADQGFPPHRIEVVYNGVDCTNIFPPNSRDTEKIRRTFRREVDASPESVLVGMAGQISLRKAPDIFLEAARLIRKAGRKALFCLAGKRFSEKEESVQLERNLHRFVKKNRLEDSVRFLGYLSDVRFFYSGIDILVNCSLQEPLGRVILEGMANGRAVVATNVGGTPEILRSGREGLLVPPGDHAALAEALELLLGDPGLRDRLGASARKRVQEFFSLQGMKEKIEGIYEQLLRS